MLIARTIILFILILELPKLLVQLKALTQVAHKYFKPQRINIRTWCERSLPVGLTEVPEARGGTEGPRGKEELPLLFNSNPVSGWTAVTRPNPPLHLLSLTQPRGALSRFCRLVSSAVFGLEFLLLLPGLLQDPSAQPGSHILFLLFDSASSPFVSGSYAHCIASQNLLGQRCMLLLIPGPTGHLEFRHFSRKTCPQGLHVGSRL